MLFCIITLNNIYCLCYSASRWTSIPIFQQKALDKTVSHMTAFTLALIGSHYSKDCKTHM